MQPFFLLLLVYIQYDCLLWLYVLLQLLSQDVDVFLYYKCTMECVEYTYGPSYGPTYPVSYRNIFYKYNATSICIQIQMLYRSIQYICTLRGTSFYIVPYFSYLSIVLLYYLSRETLFYNILFGIPETHVLVYSRSLQNDTNMCYCYYNYFFLCKTAEDALRTSVPVSVRSTIWDNFFFHTLHYCIIRTLGCWSEYVFCVCYILCLVHRYTLRPKTCVLYQSHLQFQKYFSSRSGYCGCPATSLQYLYCTVYLCYFFVHILCHVKCMQCQQHCLVYYYMQEELYYYCEYSHCTYTMYYFLLYSICRCPVVYSYLLCHFLQKYKICKPLPSCIYY
uniref:PI329L n=1 Tax=African swine fever virus TaxID=10497 RepID=A0A649YJL5_ASF